MEDSGTSVINERSRHQKGNGKSPVWQAKKQQIDFITARIELPSLYMRIRPLRCSCLSPYKTLNTTNLSLSFHQEFNRTRS